MAWLGVLLNQNKKLSVLKQAGVLSMNEIPAVSGILIEEAVVSTNYREE